MQRSRAGCGDLGGRDWLHRSVFGQAGLQLVGDSEFASGCCSCGGGSSGVVVVGGGSISSGDRLQAGGDGGGEGASHSGDGEAARVVDDGAAFCDG